MTRVRRITAAGMAAATVFVVGWVASGRPTPPCPLRTLTGVDCPGCGAARAGAALLHGDLVAVLDHNLLFLPAVAIAVYAVVRMAQGRPATPARPGLTWTAVAIVASFWVLRLLPFPPFTFLTSPRT